MSTLAFTAFGKPVPQGSHRAFNSRVIASNGSVLKPWRNTLGSAAIGAALLDDVRQFTGPVRVRATFTFRRPRAHYRTGRNAELLRDNAPPYPTSRGCGDLDKLARALGDALVDVSVLRDDDQIVEWRLNKRWTSQPGALGMPGAEVEVHDLPAMSREAYWRNQRRTKTRKTPMWACTGCGHPTAFYPPDTLLHTHTLRSLDMTTGEIDAFLGKTEPPRDRFGRPMIKLPGGGTKAYTRCTTYVGALEDTYNLGQWQQRMVALGLAQRDDLLMAVGALTSSQQDKTELNRIVNATREAAAASAGATIGTALHKMCERLDRGEKFLIPTPAKADLAAYRETTKHLSWARIEEMTVHDTLEVAGTPDRIGNAPSQRPRVYDLKTGSIDYGLAKIAMQLAMYAHSQAYDHELGTRAPLDVDLDVATIIHLPAGQGTCELVDVDIRQGWEGAQLAGQVRAWRKRKNFTPPQQSLVTLPDLIALATDEVSLRALWAAHNAEWNDELTALAKSRLAALSAA